MPTLSDLIKIRERLTTLPLDDMDAKDAVLLEEIAKISDGLKDLDTSHVIRLLKESVDLRSKALHQFRQSQIERVDHAIKEANWRYQKGSRDWCNAIEQQDDDQYKAFLKEYYPNDEESVFYCKNMMQAMSDWTDACLLYQMNDFKLADFLGFYPLYVVDKFKNDLINRLSDQSTAAHLRKIRVYTPDESYDCLPKEAMGMIVSRNHFTHTNRFFYDIELKLLASLLKPGGTLMFNFNDVETAEGALLVESKMRSYQTKTNLNEHLKSLGLEVVDWKRMRQARTTWVVAKKPGNKKTIKKAEMLGHIIKKKTNTLLT